MTDVGASAGEEIGTEADGNSRGTSGWRMRGGEPGGDPVGGGKGPNIWTVAGIAIAHLLHKKPELVDRHRRRIRRGHKRRRVRVHPG